MESSGTPTPQPEAPQPPPPPTPPPTEDGTPDRGWQLLGVILALALAFAAAVMIIVAVDIGGTPLEEDCDVAQGCTEYFDGSQAQKTIGLALGWPSGALAAIAALFALYFAATGRQGQLLLRLTGAAVVLGALSILIQAV